MLCAAQATACRSKEGGGCVNGATILAFPGVLVAPVAPALRTARTAALAITTRIDRKSVV